MTDPPRPLRLAELVASLSLATDLELGQPQEHVLRQTVLAVRLAEAAGLPEADIAERLDLPEAAEPHSRKPSNAGTATAYPPDCAATRSFR